MRHIADKRLASYHVAPCVAQDDCVLADLGVLPICAIRRIRVLCAAIAGVGNIAVSRARMRFCAA